MSHLALSASFEYLCYGCTIIIFFSSAGTFKIGKCAEKVHLLKISHHSNDMEPILFDQCWPIFYVSGSILSFSSLNYSLKFSFTNTRKLLLQLSTRCELTDYKLVTSKIKKCIMMLPGIMRVLKVKNKCFFL